MIANAHGMPASVADFQAAYASAMRRVHRRNTTAAPAPASMKISHRTHAAPAIPPRRGAGPETCVAAGGPAVSDAEASEILHACRLAYIGDRRAIEDVCALRTIDGCDRALRAETHFRARSSVLLAIARRRRALREGSESARK